MNPNALEDFLCDMDYFDINVLDMFCKDTDSSTVNVKYKLTSNLFKNYLGILQKYSFLMDYQTQLLNNDNHTQNTVNRNMSLTTLDTSQPEQTLFNDLFRNNKM
ncbi:hypothetical protein QTN25_001268 [Entamoeba marina]